MAIHQLARTSLNKKNLMQIFHNMYVVKSGIFLKLLDKRLIFLKNIRKIL